MSINLLHGDCLEQMKTLENNSVDAIVSDPPYGISFMSKKWDYDVPSVEVWKEAMRVLKPGGHALIACGTRTQHRMVCNIEDAGFEIRDVVSWIYGQGFPKSQNIHKSLKKLCKCGNMEADDKTRNNQREASEKKAKHGVRSMQDSDIQEAIDTGEKCGQVLQQSLQEQGSHGSVLREKPEESTEDGEEPSMEGWGDLQATEGELRGSEVCEMPEGVLGNGKEGRLHNGTSPSNGSEHGKTFSTDGGSPSRGSQPEQQQDRKPCPLCDEWGTQAIRRAASETQGWGSALKPSVEFFTLCRKPLSESTIAKNVLKWGTGGINIDVCRVEASEKLVRPDVQRFDNQAYGKGLGAGTQEEPQGRFPANLIHDGSQEVLDLFPENVKGAIGMKRDAGQKSIFNLDSQKEKQKFSGAKTDSGSAARFFYCPKASKKDRNEGCEELEEHDTYSESAATPMRDQRKQAKRSNNHPTVKPTALMSYLCRLITPTGGVVLDPYMGSGSTGKAAVREGFSFVGIELDPDYYEIAKARVTAETQGELKS
jgi:DNA modification methylase